MTVSLASPQDNDPLSYDRLDGKWLKWHETAHRFEPQMFRPGINDMQGNEMLDEEGASAFKQTGIIFLAFRYR